MASATRSKPKGGAFLIEDRSPDEIFTPEDFTEEHRTIARTAAEFFTNEVEPHLEAIQHQEPGVALGCMRKAGEHVGIGTLPVLYFGTEEQKQRYLPRLATVETLAAYALTEPHAGSDALAARMRADLSLDGRHYVLNGQKMWITNGAAAGLFTVFAKIGGEKFTAFLVEREFPGVSSGAEEKKMGIKGS